MKATYGPGVGAWLTDDDKCEIADATPSWGEVEITRTGDRFGARVVISNRISYAIGRTPMEAFSAAAVEAEENMS